MNVSYNNLMKTIPENLASLSDDELRHAVEIADRVWWVGHVLEDDPFQCHVYLLEQGDQSVLFDPGSRLTFPGTLRKIEEVLPLTEIKYFVCHHQDPDIAAALPLIDEIIDRPDACLVTHWRAHALLRHYGLKLPFWLIDKHDWKLELQDRELEFVFTPYAHFPGAFCTFDPATGVLFSSDLFGGFTEKPQLVAQDESHFAALRPFHEHYMPSRDILDYAMSQIARYPVKAIAPQHGSIIPEHLVGFMTDQLRHLDCGLYLLGQGDSDILRLSRLNETLREITQTMLLYRDFREIAVRLLEVVQRSLPVDRIDYYADLGDGDILTLSPEIRFSGITGKEPAEIRAIMGLTRKQWVAHHGENPDWHDHELHQESFCRRDAADGGSLITLPLYSPDKDGITAVAVLHLGESVRITNDLQQVIEQLAMPLHVALEREVIYRNIERERERAYQRSIRDSLTGLFTRFYMHDVMQRHCAVHDHNPALPVAALMVDIDHFKRINDTHGHGVGDLVLANVAKALIDAGEGTDIPVRYGGEEFILFLIGESAQRGAAIGEGLRERIAAHPFVCDDGTEIAVTASLGLAERSKRETLDDLIRRADAALYRAKEGGRNRLERATGQSSNEA